MPPKESDRKTWAADPDRSPSTALRHIRVQGSVRMPGEYKYEENSDVLHYLQKAGGTTSEVSVCKVMIIRNYGPQRRTLVFKLDESALVPKVRSGDVLVFDRSEEMTAAFTPPVPISPQIQPTVELTQRRAKNFPATNPSEARLRNSPGNTFRELLEEYIRTPQFKRLLNQIATTQAANTSSCLAILSYYPREGKSFLTAALALAYAKFLDSHVLILDTNRELDKRSPILETVAGDYNPNEVDQDLGRESSLIDLLTMESLERNGNADTDFYIGPYLNSVKAKYDLVLIDTCAISVEDTTSVDPIVVANQVDSSILLTSPRSVHRSTMDDLNEELKRLKLRLLGTVYNSAGAK